MRFVMSRTRALLVGAALIVVTNAVVLAGVAYNRSGEPESVLRLTERELRVRHWSWPEHENSTIDLHLSWRVAQSPVDGNDLGGYYGLHWLQPAQLRQLGFRVEGDLDSDEVAERLAGQPSRRAWLVLEYDGPAYQAALEAARQEAERAAALSQTNAGDKEFEDRLKGARSAMAGEEKTQSRLFVVDAGPDEAALRARYPNRQQYAIVHGRLDVSVQGETGRKRLIARLVDIDVGAIRVPHAYRTVVEPFIRGTGRYESRAPSFVATVNFGRRFEPWIVDITSLK